jgi:hypothetical protein
MTSEQVLPKLLVPVVCVGRPTLENRTQVREPNKGSKYPPAEPEALRLLVPQRGLFATVESKSNCKSKCDGKQNQGILPELSNFGSHPGRAGGLPI